MYCPVFRNHNSVPHLLAKLCYIVSIKSSNIFDIISDLCIRLHPSLPWAWLHKRTLLCKHRAVGEDAFSLIWDAREILGESTRIKELRRKLGREVFSFLAGFSSLYLSQPQQLVGSKGSPSSSSSFSSSSSSSCSSSSPCPGELSTHGRAHICPHNSQ